MQHAISLLWGYCCRECEEAVEIRSIMMAGVELVLSRRFHTAAVEALSTQSSLEFGANFSIPMTETFKQRRQL